MSTLKEEHETHAVFDLGVSTGQKEKLYNCSISCARSISER